MIEGLKRNAVIVEVDGLYKIGVEAGDFLNSMDDNGWLSETDLNAFVGLV